MSSYDMESFIKDFAERTTKNLDVINYLAESPYNKDGKRVFEVTQLINSFLGLIILPNETFKDWREKIKDSNNRMNQKIKEVESKVQILLDHCRQDRRYVNSFEDPDKPVRIFRFCDHIRNSVAHSGVYFYPLVRGEVIDEIIFYECSKRKDKEFCLKLNTKKDKELCLKLNIEEDNEVHILAGFIAELYEHIEILEGQNYKYGNWVEKLNDLLSAGYTSTEGTVAKQMAPSNGTNKSN